MLNCQAVLPKILLKIGFVEVRFYGAVIALSVLIAILLMPILAKQRKDKFLVALSTEQIWDIVFWILIIGLIFARLFYVVFYNFNYYAQNPWQIFAVWQGGLSVHGGIVGGSLALFLYTRKYKLSFWQIADLIVPFLALGLAFGRIANFVNGELIGRETAWQFGCDFGDGVNRWPVQLFDSAKNFTIFFITLFLFLKTNLKSGMIAGIFLSLIGLLRFTMEFLREPDRQLGFIYSWLTAGQMFAIVAFLSGIIMIFYLQITCRRQQ